MEAISMNFREWKHRNFYRLLWVYLKSGLALEDWDQYCIDQYAMEQRKVRLS